MAGGLKRGHAIVAIVMLAALAGCGFRPLYGHHAGDPAVDSEMNAIYVEPMPDREGQLVHNALLVRFNPNPEAGPARYRLQTSVTVNEAPTVLQSDETASRAVVTFGVNYSLFEGSVSLTSGEFIRLFSYDYVPEQYSNVSARADVGRRAAEEIANEIRNRIAAYFAAGEKARRAAGMSDRPAAQPAQ